MSGGSLPHFLNCIIEVDMLGNWKNPHFGSLTHEVRALVDGRAHRKFLFTAIVNWKQFSIPGESSETGEG